MERRDSGMKLDALYKYSGRISVVLAHFGALSLFGMMTITLVDVVSRYIFNAPILGVFELTEYLVLILIFSFLGFTQAQKMHVAVDLLVDRFDKRPRVITDLINHTVCLVLMVLIAWKSMVNALDLMDVGEASPNLAIPDYPFAFFLVLGCVVMCVEYVRDLIRLAGMLKEGGES
jgi:TRAP-type transport system small permease protein